MPLKLTNKTIDTQRLVAGAYQANLSGIKMRYESLAPIKGKLSQIGKEKAMYIVWAMMVDTIDLKISDRITVQEDNITLVVASKRTATDRELDHLEVLLREIESEQHQDIIHKTLESIQTNLDPIFKQWGGAKQYTDTTIKALVDPVKPGLFVDLQNAGRISDSEFVVTLDLPLTPTLKDKFEFNGVEYFIDRIETMPYQTLCMVSKVTPKGKQFS